MSRSWTQKSYAIDVSAYELYESFVYTTYIWAVNIQSVSGIGSMEFKGGNPFEALTFVNMNTQLSVNHQLELFVTMRNSSQRLGKSDLYDSMENGFLWHF